ncbi:MAG: glycoside hydrolase family 16 protein [Hellea sp.]|nr:glycoside hydrolase family 16 protein [Hellea sp.]
MKKLPILLMTAGLLGVSSCGGDGGSSAAPPPSGGGSGGGTGGGTIVLPIPPPAPDGDDYHPEGAGWVPAWSDEFDGSEIDRTKWEVEVSCWGGGNDERQCYTDRSENIEIINGLLRLKAYPETFTGPEFPQGWPDGRGGQITRQYTSGKVRTREIADWTYGRFSARMKLPKGQGTWPAFWMLPADNIYGGWAASGEIDIMEAVNLGALCNDCDGNAGENRSSGALHFGGEWPNNRFEADKWTLQGGDEAADQYHVFAIEWGEGRMNWFVDGVKLYTIDSESWYSDTVDKADNPYAPFDQDFYLMFNLAVGGNLSEGNNQGGFDVDSYPNEVLVDWVRVYQCEFDGTTGRNCMDGENE